MRVLLVGGGGREHALAWAMARHGHSLWFTHPNPGMAPLGETILGEPLATALHLRPELVVVGPEAPLAAGLVDALTAHDIPAFGPSAAAAKLESSKIFTKALVLGAGLSTAKSVVLRRQDSFTVDQPWVVKLDGLAAGKGVWVCQTVVETQRAISEAFAARPDADVLLEEVLVGPEVSVLGISDGARVVPLAAARDHKRRFTGDLGPNTGGMGAIAPVEIGAAALATCHEALERSVIAMNEAGTPFRGVLYGGFMLTEQGPKLLEFNVRFGDPECQPLMMLWDEDPVPWFLGSAKGRLPGAALRFRSQHAACVVISAENYPESSANAAITALPTDAADLVVFHAGTTLREGQLWATGGRVLGVTATAPTAAAARARAYEGAALVRFAGAAFRSDIGGS